MTGTSGTIFQIERFSIHDGPGIRSTVFLKGCPLNCWWCHNPESQRFDLELTYRESRCIKCWSCVSACPESAIKRSGDDLIFDRLRCNGRGECVRACQSQAREFVGRRTTVSEVIEEVEKDLAFYDESGGGVTFSGGEPFAQPEFLLELLKQCKAREIRTAVDTCGLTARKNMIRAAELADLFLYDLKLMDEAKHLRYTGASNRLILENLESLSALGSSVLVRVPLIPGINDDEENIGDLARFLAGLPLPPHVSLLPYHRAGVHKYAGLGRTYALSEIQEPSAERMAEVRNSLEMCGLGVTAGGG
jgi:pyruvate formate lyase activating enzyme